ncbi:class I SAM-dependent methyltransferase [Bacillaceae bacterium SIJ1]|uniref:class I SAM-dependent methyltransferase n=1 Tax=Litoribacterium kuwaitense TaxID=1398745 RepID=UPI0013EAC4F5|nr:class I SAM-dependent methyltransferase [Litoribacterium kuwaitense]NGP46107.1 class I SAM-dependent methyltransferase [Litoribacterium kuwaitense]
MSRGMVLEDVVCIGRTFHEYVRMFALNEADLINQTVLDCPAGVCSFTAEAAAKGIHAVASDVAYAFTAEDLHAKGLIDLETIKEAMLPTQDRYVWTEYGNIEGLAKERMTALKTAIADRLAYPARYIEATLPHLPFSDEHFDLVLSAHFLFLYDDHFDVTFHTRSLEELLRVCRKELRIYPLVGLHGKASKSFEPCKQLAIALGHKVTIEPVPYEFLKGATSMMRIQKR